MAGWLSRRPRTGYPGAGHTHRKAVTAGLHPHHEQHRHTHPAGACSVRRCGYFLRATALGARSRASPWGSGGPPRALFAVEEDEATDYEDALARWRVGHTPFGLCPWTSTDRLVTGSMARLLVAAGGVPAVWPAAAAGAVPCGQTPGRAAPGTMTTMLGNARLPRGLEGPEAWCRRLADKEPHDPDVTYRGHKGKGYELQVSRRPATRRTPRLLITHVEVTPSSGSDHRRDRAGR